MAITNYDLVRDTTATTGTGTISLSSIAAGVGYRTFASCVTSGHTVAYKITATGGAWEIGTGVVTSGTPWTLTRAAILASSNANAVVNFPSGTKFVSIVHPASLIVKKDGDTFTGQMNFPVGGLVVGSGNPDSSARVTIKAGNTNPSTALLLRSTSSDTGSIRVEMTPGTNTTSYISDYYTNKASHIRFTRNNSTGNSTFGIATGSAWTPVETFAINEAGNISLGLASNATFHASSTMFPSVIPRVEIKTGVDGATAYDNLLVLRGIATASAVMRRTGIVLKGSSEGSAGESSKMAAMYIETSVSNGNAPSLKFATANAERMTIDSSGNVAIGTTPSTAYKFRVGTALAGSAGPVIGIRCDSVVQSDVTSSAFGFSSSLTTAAAAFTLTDLYHYSTSQPTFGAGSTVTNQTGYLAAANFTGATNNFGFVGGIPAGTNRWNLYMSGTAQNYIAGNLLIGTTTTSNGAGQIQITNTTNSRTLTVTGTAADSSAGIGYINDARSWSFGVRGDVSDAMVIRDLTAGADRIFVDSSGQLGVGVTPTARNNTRLQIVDGIGFPATQVASSDANTLDDYEEGTFTPTIVGTTLAGAGTYTMQSGKYTKVGNVVSFTIYLTQTAHTGTGSMRLAGLPFTAAGSNSHFAVSIGYLQNCTLPADTIPMAYVFAGATYIELNTTPLGGGAYATLAMDTAFSTIISGQYFV